MIKQCNHLPWLTFSDLDYCLNFVSVFVEQTLLYFLLIFANIFMQCMYKKICIKCHYQVYNNAMFKQVTF